MRMVSRMKMAHKLAMIVIVLMLPLTYVTVEYAAGLRSRINEHALADDGLHYFEGLKEAGRGLAAHASFTATVLAGEANAGYFGQKIKEAAARFDSSIAIQDQAEAKFGRAGSPERALWSDIKAEWAALRHDWPKLTPELSAARHDALSAKLTKLVRLIAETHHLDRDGDLEQFYLQDLAVLQIPRLSFEFGALRAAAAPVAAQMLSITQDQEAKIDALTANIRLLMDDAHWRLDSLTVRARATASAGTTASATATASASPSKDTAFALQMEQATDALHDTERSFEAYQHWVASNILTRRPVGVASQEVMEQSASFESNLAALHDRLMDQVRVRSAQRLSSERWERNLALTFVAAMTLTAILLAGYFTRALTRSMRRVVKTFTAIEAGQYDNQIIVDSNDETGKVLRSLDKMQTTLRGRIEADRAALAENQRMLAENRRMLAENTRVRQALDTAGTIVLVVDESHQIVYANEAAKTTFAQLQNDLQADLPAFTATSPLRGSSPVGGLSRVNESSLVGASIDIFKPIPCLDRAALTALRGPHTETLSIGGHTLLLSATPIIGDAGLNAAVGTAALDATGTRLGTVLEWRSRTREVALEHEVRTVVEEALKGDLRARLPVDGKTGFHANLAGGLNEILENLSTMVRTIKHAVIEIRSSADEIAHGNAELSGRTQTQASALEQTGSAMEQMTATVKQNADNAAHADRLAATAREHAEKGGEVVSAAVTAMQEINESSHKIADIVGVIDAIAFQTNLLALNAAVEAARAGEQGRGFAVVASEVRGLARRSAEAAKEIKTLIRDSVVKVEEGAKLVDQSGAMLQNIVGAVQNVNIVVAEIASASREQSAGISEVNSAIAKIDEMTGKNSVLVEQDAAAAQALLTRANDLSTAMNKYRISEPAGQTSERQPSEITTRVGTPSRPRRLSAGSFR